MRDGLTPATAIFGDRVSGGARGGKMRLGRDERGLLGVAWLTLPILITGILGLLGISAVASVNWEFILALFAMGIIGISFVGVLFFKADKKLILFAILASTFIIVLVEVSFPVLVGGIIAIAAMWNMKLLKKRPLMLVTLVMTGLITMVWGSYAIILPMGILP